MNFEYCVREYKIILFCFYFASSSHIVFIDSNPYHPILFPSTIDYPHFNFITDHSIITLAGTHTCCNIDLIKSNLNFIKLGARLDLCLSIDSLPFSHRSQTESQKLNLLTPFEKTKQENMKMKEKEVEKEKVKQIESLEAAGISLY